MNMMLKDVPMVDVRTPQDLEEAIVGLQEDELLVLEFWAPGAQPCKALAPVLEKVARKYAPRVHIARINISEQPELAQHFRVQGIPAVKMICGGKLVGQFNGAQPEQVIDEYLKKALPQPIEQKNAVDSACELLAAGEAKGARALLHKVIAADPQNVSAQLALARCQVLLHDGAAAQAVLDTLDAPDRLVEIDRIKLLIEVQARCAALGGMRVAAERAKQNPQDVQAMYDWACCLVLDVQFDAACAGLLSLIERDKDFHHGEARKLLVAVFDLLGADPRVAEYRRRLASALYI
jgi:putative thioredoxin